MPLLGRVLNINSHPMTVIGMAARGFHGYEAWQPFPGWIREHI